MSKQVVKEIKANLVRRGVDLSGPKCFNITGRVAWELRENGFRLLSKRVGNRAIVMGDGSIKGQDDPGTSGVMGYATDYLIHLPDGKGYDILGDGGGANKPQWPDSPEDHPDIVRRNLGYWVIPVNLEPTEHPEPIPPTPTPITLDTILNVITSLRNDIGNLHQEMRDRKYRNRFIGEIKPIHEDDK